MDQGRQASGRDDAVELPSVPVQRGAAVVESNRLQSGESVATVGAAQEDRQLDAHQLAAKVGKDRGTFGQACPVLLAALGRESSDSATVWEHGPADRLVAFARRVGELQIGADFGGEVGRGVIGVGAEGRNNGNLMRGDFRGT